jgi:hypothetical protein
VGPSTGVFDIDRCVGTAIIGVLTVLTVRTFFENFSIAAGLARCPLISHLGMNSGVSI